MQDLKKWEDATTDADGTLTFPLGIDYVVWGRATVTPGQPALKI